MNSADLEPGGLYTRYEITESPETGENVPVVISWWHHPDPSDPQVRAAVSGYRDLIRTTRMDEHMAHHLVERPGGERTRLSLAGTRGRLQYHPLPPALADGAEVPVPDPVPYDIGHTVVHADIGVYVLVASPLSGPPGWDDLISLVRADPGGVGMARFELHADDDARSHYRSRPPSFGLSDELVNRVYGERDVALREGLRLLFGIPRPGERHI